MSLILRKSVDRWFPIWSHDSDFCVFPVIPHTQRHTHTDTHRHAYTYTHTHALLGALHCSNFNVTGNYSECSF